MTRCEWVEGGRGCNRIGTERITIGGLLSRSLCKEHAKRLNTATWKEVKKALT